MVYQYTEEQRPHYKNLNLKNLEEKSKNQREGKTKLKIKQRVSAYEIFNLLKENKLDSDTYFKLRAKKAKIVRKRSYFNFFAFHFSNPLIQNIRNMIFRFLVKRKKFIESYLCKDYEN